MPGQGDIRKRVGSRGEECARAYLLAHGYVIKSMNWHTKVGEIDIVALKERKWVFVEVRSTRGASFGLGFQSVDQRKQQQVRRLAQLYLQQNQLIDAPIRFDVISIWFKNGIEREPELYHLQGAF
ncbi:YraN family protein [Mechercharimyces sp. CAU 1602]|uniref:YraN family protein n=1 Tax=Mechercharimyces sp. CAU 1602 TaxID=2973933 RepID=UPI002162CDDA|nr:YraN family protein [Mechercharimyces sp. CAU 1602]MCS1351349.1 YraN family protein [Mechercharimyces sp. CAU 1602]